MKIVIDELIIIFHQWNSSASDGLNKFFKITILNNNWRELCIFVSHNIHYLIFGDISAQ